MRRFKIDAVGSESTATWELDDETLARAKAPVLAQRTAEVLNENISWTLYDGEEQIDSGTAEVQ